MKEKNCGDEQSSTSRGTDQKGGWRTLPFTIATTTGIALAFGGLASNLIVYLIQEFNIKSISAAKIFNVFNAVTTILPIASAIIADSFLGCYSVIWFSSIFNSLGLLLIVLTAAFRKLRPPQCENGSNLCTHPSQLQLAVLYLGLGLASIGMAGTRFTVGPMGAHQLDKPRHQTVFFNWYIFAIYISTAIASTVIVYVENNVSWAWGFGICLAGNVFASVIFLAGSKFYRPLKPEGSPFVVLARVIVAAIKKRKLIPSQKPEEYCHDTDHKEATIPSKFFGFLNKAAQKEAEGDMIKPNPWRLCKVEDVEDLKGLIKILPLWSTGLFLSTPLVIQLSLTVIQALAMDRHLKGLNIPAGSMSVFMLLSTCITVFILDRFVYPLWEKKTKFPIKLLQRVGIGHVIDIISMAALALIEAKRLSIVNRHHLQDQDNAVAPMSVFWLVPPLVIAGIGEALFFPAQIAFYFQEFPGSLKSTSTAFVALYMGIAYYLGNVVIDLVRKTTDWLPDDINRGRLDNVYWLVCVLGGINFVYYLVCACMYKYRDSSDNVSDEYEG